MRLHTSPTATFEWTEQITAINLSHNMIRYLRNWLFEKLGSLVIINLSNNLLELLAMEMLETIHFMKEIYVKSSRIKHLILWQLKGNIFEIIVDVSGNEIDNLSQAIYNLSSMNLQ